MTEELYARIEILDMDNKAAGIAVGLLNKRVTDLEAELGAVENDLRDTQSAFAELRQELYGLRDASRDRVGDMATTYGELRIERDLLLEALKAGEVQRLGYRMRCMASPYLWSFSNLYEKGKFSRTANSIPRRSASSAARP